MTTTIHHGPWVTAPNLSADAVGSIHDDRQARDLGFRGALIGGSVLLAFLEPLLREGFGPDWYERGFLKLRLRFSTPATFEPVAVSRVA